MLDVISLNRRLPWLKHLLPYRVKRWVLLRMGGVMKGYVAPPSRKWLEECVLPVLAGEGHIKVMFVGAAPYTCHYEGIADKLGFEWFTADINPSARMWGARKHVIADVGSLSEHFPREYFDVVILNGVFGSGVNSPSQMNAALISTHQLLRQNGILVLGWNDDLMPDPSPRIAGLGAYDQCNILSWEQRKTFREETHVYDFWTAVKPT